MPPKRLRGSLKKTQSISQGKRVLPVIPRRTSSTKADVKASEQSQGPLRSTENLSTAQNTEKILPEHSRRAQGARRSRTQLKANEPTDIASIAPLALPRRNSRYNLRSTAPHLSEHHNEDVETNRKAGQHNPKSLQDHTKTDKSERQASLSVRNWVNEVNNDISQGDIAACNPLLALGTPYTALVYRSHGYDPTDEEMASTEIASSVAASQYTVRDVEAKRLKKTCLDARNTEFYGALRERNVDFKRSDDGKKNSIHKMIHRHRTPIPTDEEERNWDADLDKCESSDESVFQRTIMMDLLDRHRLECPLDYACESTWQCCRMPRKMVKGAKEMARPKPDLAVSFKSSSIVSTFAFSDLGTLKGVMCPEALKEGKDDRAFPFFAVEVKGAQGEVGNITAIRQNFNIASQALHNIYTFMKEAGQEKKFYSEVRFYSAIATSASFQLRVHRAVELKESRIQPDYPLGFMFDEVYRSKGDRYSKAEVSRMVKNVLFEYGLKILLPVLKESVILVLEKIRAKSLESQSRKRPVEESFAESFTSSQRMRVDNLHMNEVSPQAA